MRSLLLHCKTAGYYVTGLATRPKGIVHGDLEYNKELHADNCILVLITVEDGDTIEKMAKLVDEVSKFAEETKEGSIFISPFAHLSKRLSDSKVALDLLGELVSALSKKYKVLQGHFGSDKEAWLHLHGHPGNARYRKLEHKTAD